MNILNLPAPTAGAEFGQALGQLLGQGAGVGLNVYTRNKAMDYLNEILPPKEQIEGTSVEGPQFYNQREREQALRNAPFYLRGQLNQIIDERNKAAAYEKDLANQYGDIAENIINQINPEASPLTRANFRNKAVKLLGQRASPQQVQQYIAREGKLIGDAGSALQNSVEDLRTQPLSKLGKTISGEFVPSDSLVKSLQVSAKPLIDFGEVDLVRRLLKPLGLRDSDIEKITGGTISNDVEQFLNKAPKVETTFDEDLKTFRPNNPEDLKLQIKDVFQIQPNTNLVLLRQKLIDQKKTDWNTFRDIVADLSNSGEIQLSPDQRNQIAILMRPERNLAQKALETASLEDGLLQKIFQKFSRSPTLTGTIEGGK